MPEAGQQYRYVAVDAGGRRARGVVAAPDELAAYARLRGDGLSPVSLRSVRAAGPARPGAGRLTDREVADLVGNLGQLLAAGADIRTSLGILGNGHRRPPVAEACRALIAEISGGGGLEASFSRLLGRQGPLVGALVAAGEASGDLPGGLARAAEIIDSGITLRGKLGSVLAYPAFVLVSTVAAVLALLLGVIPSLAPLVQESEAGSPVSLRLMIGASDFIRSELAAIGLLLAGGALAALVAQRAGVLRRLVDEMLLRGPVRRTARSLAFGSFAIAAGGMLAAGAPMSDTLRLAVRSLRSEGARHRLEPIVAAVRQGQTLSGALESVDGLPPAIARLAAVGEATGSLGPMLLRAGKLEEQAALARIERLGQLLGPMLIVGLGGVVGLLMATLLSGVSDLGQSALE